MKNDKISTENILSRLGLSDNEAKTYAALFELESASIRKVAERSGINRGTTYEAVKSLVAYGLASVRQNGKREQYVAESPEKIYDIIRDKRKDLIQIQDDSKKLVPALLARAVRNEGEPLVRYYQDEEGVATILRDVLQTCGQLEEPGYHVYSSQALRKYLYRKFPKFTERRIAEGIFVKVIAIGQDNDLDELSARRWLPGPSEGALSSYTLIYGNKVAIISISDNLTPYGVVVEDAGSAAMHRLLFEQLWASLG